MLDGSILGNLMAEGGSETHDCCGGLGQTLGVVGIFLRGLVNEGAAGAARGDIGKRVRTVSRVDEIAQKHHVIAYAFEPDVVWLKGAKDSLEIVHILGESRVSECFFDSACVQRNFDGEVIANGKTELARSVFGRPCWRWTRHGDWGCAEEGHVF